MGPVAAVQGLPSEFVGHSRARGASERKLTDTLQAGGRPTSPLSDGDRSCPGPVAGGSGWSLSVVGSSFCPRRYACAGSLSLCALVLCQSPSSQSPAGAMLTFQGETRSGTCVTGKTAVVFQVTRADVDVQPYAFTTKSLFVGHMDYKYLRWQVSALASDAELASRGWFTGVDFRDP